MPPSTRRLPPPVGRPRPVEHLARRAAGERQEQDPLGRRAALDEAGDARAERGRLPGARAREHEQVSAEMVGSRALLLVEAGERAIFGYLGGEHVFDRV